MAHLGAQQDLGGWSFLGPSKAVWGRQAGELFIIVIIYYYFLFSQFLALQDR